MKAILALIASFLVSISTAQALGMPKGPPVTCPKELRPTGTLLIGLRPGLGSELAILRKSDGALFVLVSKAKTLLIPSDDFKNVPLFQLNVDAEIEAQDGTTQTIFNSPGEYQVIFSNDVMAKKGGHRCTFRFTTEL